jgi:hypothetical protein
MSAQVSNLTMAGSAARLSRALAAAASVRPQQVDGVDGSAAAPARDETGPSTGFDSYESGPSRRRPTVTADMVVSFGGVLISREVGATLTQAQAASAHYPPLPIEAERQIAHYEFAQSLMGPPVVGPALEPFHPMQ